MRWPSIARPRLRAAARSREDEAFYVIEGEYLFGGTDGEGRAGPGTFVHAPRGHLHWWRNVHGPGRHLESLTPAGLEKMVEEVGQPASPTDTGPRSGVTFRPPDRR